jgi:hypothetical protein
MVLVIPAMLSVICYHARLVKVKNVSADVSERQALSSLIRCSSSREPIMKYDSLSTVVSRVDVGANLAGLEHCRDISLFPSSWERSENRLKRLLSCVGMSKLLEWFLLFLRTMASSHATLRKFCLSGYCPNLSFGSIGTLSWVLLNPRHRVRLDVLPACGPVSREGTKTHDLSIPKNLGTGFPPSPEESLLLARLALGKP